MKETRSFVNKGFGWECVACSAELFGEIEQTPEALFFLEGEADRKRPQMVLAKWADAARTALVCPRCGIRESLEVA